MKIQLCVAKSNDDWPPVPESKPETFKDIFKGATQELQAISERRTAKMFPPFDIPEPDFTADELVKPQLDPVKYRDPKYGFFGESFVSMLNAERDRMGRTPDGDKES